MVYEAHSTDYQVQQSLSQLVQDHFATRKVGPELTFKYREAIFALGRIEISIAKFNSEIEPSQISQVIDQEMVSNAKYWDDYFSGSEGMLAFSRKFSLNDCIRYYWSRPKVQESLEKLFSKLDMINIPLPLVSRYLPEQYQKIYQGDLSGYKRIGSEVKSYQSLRNTGKRSPKNPPSTPAVIPIINLLYML